MRFNFASIPPRDCFRSCVKKLSYLASVDPSAALYDIDSVCQRTGHGISLSFKPALRSSSTATVQHSAGLTSVDVYHSTVIGGSHDIFVDITIDIRGDASPRSRAA